MVVFPPCKHLLYIIWVDYLNVAYFYFASRFSGILQASLIRMLLKLKSENQKLNVLLKSTYDAYRKLITTTYQIALNPTMNLNHFSVIVDIQQENGVRLISGNLIFM